MLFKAQSNVNLDLFKNCNSSPRVGAGGPGQPPLPGSGPVVQTVTRGCGQMYTRAQSVTALQHSSVSAGVTNSEHRQASPRQPGGSELRILCESGVE